MSAGIEQLALDLTREIAMEEAEYRPLPGLLQNIANTLDCRGWRREVAGEGDFTAAVRAWSRIRSQREGERKKGLFVWGGYGVGKTAYLDIVSRFYRPLRWLNLAEMVDSDFLDERVWPNWNREAMNCHIVLDDLGSEPTLNDYGIRRELAGEFIVRYHLRGRGRLFISTNLTGEGLSERYGMRVCSRIKELCVPLNMRGRDKRQWGTGNGEKVKP